MWCKAVVRAALGLVAWAGPALAQQAPSPELVRDVNPQRPVYDPENPYGSAWLGYYESLGETAVFLAGDLNASGCVLWRSDGTDAGTAALVDLCPPDLPDASAAGILGRARHLVFASDSSRRLWRTDGTREGSFPFDEVLLGLGLGSWLADPPGSRLLFSGCTADAGCELWASDGTRRGTVRLADLVPGPESGDPHLLTAAGDRVVFVAGTGASASLWTTDGTGPGTHELTRLGEAAGVQQILPLGGKLLLRSSRVTGYRISRDSLWALDVRSRRPSRLLDLDCFEFYSCTTLHPAGPEAFLSQADSESYEGLALWRTDGTRSGTRRIRHPRLQARWPIALKEVGERVVFAGSADNTPLTFWTIARGSERAVPLDGCPGGCPDAGKREAVLAVHGGVLYFAGRDAAHGLELWATDGTGPGTRLVADLCPGPCDGAPNAFRSLGRVLLFASRNRLWATEGRARGAVELAALRPFPEGADRVSLDLAAAGGGIVFEGFDGAHGIQLWSSDLTPRGGRAVAAVATLGASSRPSSLTSLGGRAIFAACEGEAAALFTSDGTAAGTGRLAGPAPVGCDLLPYGDLPVVGDLAFVHWDGQLWRSDGTDAGTFPVGPPFERVWSPVELAGRLLFVVPPSLDQATSWAWEFWESDGTDPGTRLLFRLPLGGSPSPLTVTGGEAFFIAQVAEPPFTYTVWRTDGSEAGTRPLLGIDVPSFDLPAARLGGVTYFLAGVEGRPWGPELWATDGTAAGTVPVLAAPIPPRPLQATGLFAWRDALYFLAGVGAGGPVGLWRSDGTADGTALLRRFAPPPPYSGPPAPLFTPLGDRLFFRADDGVHGLELWVTDGTADGTALLADVRPGLFSSQLSGLRAAAGRLYFAASDGRRGLELWASNGTSTGTRLAADVWPGLPSAAPEQLAAVGSALLFTADDGLHGRELWRLPFAPAPCETTVEVLCLLDGRVRAEVFWRTGGGPWRPAASALPLGAGRETGLFSLQPWSGADVTVRLAEGSDGVTAHLAGLSTAEWALVLTDAASRARRRYFNVAGRLGSLFDPTPFGGGASAADRVIPASSPAAAAALAGRQGEPCQPGPRRLCLLDRYAVEAVWRRPGGSERAAPALPVSAVSGLLAVNGPAKPGMVVKAVDGRAINGHVWIFVGSLTGLEVTVTVTDTATGASRSYFKPAGEVLSFGDTSAF